MQGENINETNENAKITPVESISRTIENEDLITYSEKISYEGNSYSLFFLTQEGCQLPQPLSKVLVQHMRDVVLNNQNVMRGDCAMVAGEVSKALSKTFEKNGYSIGTIGTESKTPISFYEGKGFGHHIVNLIEGEEMSAAIDLTASYTMDRIDVAGFHIFGVVANSTEDVERIMTKITQTRWEAR